MLRAGKEQCVKGETYQVCRIFLVQIKKSPSAVPIDTPEIRVFWRPRTGPRQRYPLFWRSERWPSDPTREELQASSCEVETGEIVLSVETLNCGVSNFGRPG
jgi:hypothetical protein